MNKPVSVEKYLVSHHESPQFEGSLSLRDEL